MSKNKKVKIQMSKINNVNFDGAYFRSFSRHFVADRQTSWRRLKIAIFKKISFQVYPQILDEDVEKLY